MCRNAAGGHAAAPLARSTARVACGGVLGLSAEMEVLPDLRTVLNVRDMASVTSSNIKPGRLFRTACVGTAVDGDAEGVVPAPPHQNI